MVYVSAKYQPRSPIASPDSPQPVQAIDDEGNVWALTEDSQVGDWLLYLENGGTIDPADPPSPADLPVPKADPDVVMDAI
jgi:hypothetical protein